MKRLRALIFTLVLCFSLSGCIVSVPTDLPEIPKMEKVVDADLLYPNSVTTENHVTGITTVTKFEYEHNLAAPVIVTVYENDIQVDSYEVQFDGFANLIRIGETEIENTYDEENRLIRSVYTENGEVTKIIKREFDENGRLASEAVCDSDEVMVTFDIYTFEGEYGSYANVDHHDADARCFGYSNLSFNTHNRVNQQETYDSEGTLLCTTNWNYFQHKSISYQPVE